MLDGLLQAEKNILKKNLIENEQKRFTKQIIGMNSME